MVGRMKVLRGVPAPATVLPQVRMNALDQIIAGIRRPDGRAAVLYDIDPSVLAAGGGYTLSGFDRASGAAIRGERACLSRIVSEPTFNGAPVINIDATGGTSSDLTLHGRPTDSFTFVAVASIAADLKATPAVARLINAMEGSTIRAYIAMIQTGEITVTTAVPRIPAVDVPAAEVPAIYVYTFDATSLDNRLYMNSNVLRANAPSPSAIPFSENTVIAIGGMAGTSNVGGWRGKVARQLVFEGALTETQIGTLVDGLGTAYGVTVA